MPIVRWIVAAITLTLCLTQLPWPLGVPAAAILLALETRDPDGPNILATLLQRPRRRRPQLWASLARPVAHG